MTVQCSTYGKSPIRTSRALIFFSASVTVSSVRLLWLTRWLLVIKMKSLAAPALNGYSVAFISPRKPSLSKCPFLLRIPCFSSLSLKKKKDNYRPQTYCCWLKGVSFESTPTTLQAKNLIGRTIKTKRAARAARTLEQFRAALYNTTARNYHNCRLSKLQ